MIRLVIADDQAVVRAGLSVILGAEEDIDVIGEAADGAEAVKLARSLQPDVVCMDIRMPGVDGIEATRAIVSDPDVDADVLILTTFDIDDDVLASLEAGAAGFLLKGADEATLLGAVRSVAAGDGTLDQRVTRRILHELARRSPRSAQGNSGQDAGGRGPEATSGVGGSVASVRMTPGAGADTSPGVTKVPHPGGGSEEVSLTARELDVLRLLSQGLSNSEIAHQLYVEPTTVKYHLTGLMQKSGSRDRLQVALWGIRTGLVDPGTV